MQRGRVLVRLDDLDRAGEDEPGRFPKSLGLQLPDAIHQNIARAYAGANQSAGTLILALNRDRFSYIADNDSIQLEQLRSQKFLEVLKHADAEVVEHTSIGEGLMAEVPAWRPHLRLAELERWEEARECGGGRNCHRHCGQTGARLIDPNAITIHPSSHHQQAIAVE